MKRRFALFPVLSLVCSVVVAVLFVNLICDQTYSNITIMADGSVEGTNLIQRNGDVYTFTGDIFGAIKVEKDGITIDGAGYAIKGNRSWIGMINENGLDLRKNSTYAIPPAYGNVVVKNVRFCDNNRIFASSAGNSFINNNFEGGGIDIKGNDGDGKGNVIKYNVFIDDKPSISADYSVKNVVTENDFINCKIFLALYGRVDFDRNYWSDYETLYPDAKEIGHTGIWDTPYNYNRTDWSDFPFLDSKPLVHPTNGAGTARVNYEPTPVLNPLIGVVLFIVIVLSVLAFRRYRKQLS